MARSQRLVGMASGDQVGVFGMAQGDEGEEGSDGRQAGVSGADAVWRRVSRRLSNSPITVASRLAMSSGWA
jgi:hypothetical protein